MNNRLLLLSLCIISLVIPMALRGAALEYTVPSEGNNKFVDITYINNTNSGLWIFRNLSEYQRTIFDRLNFIARQMQLTVKGIGPYKVSLYRVPLKASLTVAIPNINVPTEIRITENPAGSENYQVWYRDTQTGKKIRQQALAVMAATHKRTGEEAVSLGGEIGSPGRESTYKQIAEYLFEKGWQQAAPITH